METFYLILITLYVWLLWTMERSWNGPDHPTGQTGEFHAALLIPYRNETQHLPALLINLQKVIPPSVEIYLIDDFSEDDSREIIEAFLKDNIHLNWKSLENQGLGKKAALSTAIQHTGADIILTTDADCQLQEHWVRRMCQPFGNASIQMVAGPVMSSPVPGLFTKFQQLDWAGILLLTRFLFSRAQALLCSGANLAYRKSAFVELEGYSGNETYASGDDEFLLKKVIQGYGKNAVLYQHRGDVLVMTQPLERWGDFVWQRVRWASKWRVHQSLFHGFTAFLTYLLAFLQIGSLILLWGNLGSISILAAFWVLKIGVEKKALGTVLSSFRMKLSLHSYVLTSFLHPLYILFVGPLAVIGNYSWKGRKYHS